MHPPGLASPAGYDKLESQGGTHIMTIHLPKDVESSINAAILGGRFASADDMVAEIVRDYFRQGKREQPAATPSSGHGSLGAMRDAAAELDEAVEHAMNLRQRPWRLPHDE